MSNEAEKYVDMAKRNGYLDDKDFRSFIHDIVTPKGGYLVDWGTNLNVNAFVAIKLYNRIKKHPLIWKLFFTL